MKNVTLNENGDWCDENGVVFAEGQNTVKLTFELRMRPDGRWAWMDEDNHQMNNSPQFANEESALRWWHDSNRIDVPIFRYEGDNLYQYGQFKIVPSES
jgi:hypothetical protein